MPRGPGRGLAFKEPRAVTQAVGQTQSSCRALTAESLCPASEALISVLFECFINLKIAVFLFSSKH